MNARRVSRDPEEARLRKAADDLPAGTPAHIAALTELADYLQSQVRGEEAKELYGQAVTVRLASSEAARALPGQRKAEGDIGTVEAPSRLEFEDGGWEAGNWTADIAALQIDSEPKAHRFKAHEPKAHGPRVPNRQRPARALFNPAARYSSTLPGQAEGPNHGTDSAGWGAKQGQQSFGSAGWDDVSEKEEHGQPSTDSADWDAEAAKQGQGNGYCHDDAVQNGKSYDTVRVETSSAQPGAFKPLSARPPARSHLAKLQRGSRGSIENYPKGLDPPGLKEAPEEMSAAPYGGRHILEIMGVKETDGDALLDTFIKDIQEFDIQPVLRWADSCHALVVFAEFQDAEIALEKAPMTGRLWLRPYEQASAQCKQIDASELMPPTVRPKTSAVVVKRLLCNALKNRDILDLDGEKEMRAQRKERTAERERKQKQLDAAWED